MEHKKSLLGDIKSVLFSPRQFFEHEYGHLSSQRIYLMSFLCLMFGLIVGGGIPYLVTTFIEENFKAEPNLYLPGLMSLTIDKDEFLELLKIQKAYSLLLALLSPVIAYMAPHLFGGSLFVSLKLLVRQQDVKFDFAQVMECSAIALCPIVFYGLPIVGPFVATVMVYLCLSLALRARYRLIGFMKSMSIIFAMYICFFLPSASLQLLAVPVAKLLNL